MKTNSCSISPPTNPISCPLPSSRFTPPSIAPPRPPCSSSHSTHPDRTLIIFTSISKMHSPGTWPKIKSNPSLEDSNSRKIKVYSVRRRSTKTRNILWRKRISGTFSPPRLLPNKKKSRKSKISKVLRIFLLVCTKSLLRNPKQRTRRWPTRWLRSWAERPNNKILHIKGSHRIESYRKINTT